MQGKIQNPAMKKINNTLRPILILVLLAVSCAVEAQECKTYAFVERDSTLYLDVYKPVNPREDKAAVMALFGGGFFSGARNNWYMKQTAQSLLERGFTVISIDYRLGFHDSVMVAQNHKLLKLPKLFKFCIDIAVEDCAAAVAWVCSNAGMLDIDPSKLILTGSSAGAITTGLLQSQLPERGIGSARWLETCRSSSLLRRHNVP